MEQDARRADDRGSMRHLPGQPIGGLLRPAQVLLLEDDPEDAMLARQALHRSRLKIELTWVDSGEQGMEYLRRQGRFVTATTPDLLLLDLNMPRMSGYDVLRQIRSDPELAHLPVVILTTSLAHEDVARGYALGANAYVAKPMGLASFVDVLEAIDAFWFSVVILPAPVS